LVGSGTSSKFWCSSKRERELSSASYLIHTLLRLLLVPVRSINGGKKKKRRTTRFRVCGIKPIFTLSGPTSSGVLSILAVKM
jgi:hypothetical protein